MREVRQTDASTKILGHKSSLPVFVSAAGLAKLGHPLGIIFSNSRLTLPGANNSQVK